MLLIGIFCSLVTVVRGTSERGRKNVALEGNDDNLLHWISKHDHDILEKSQMQKMNAKVDI